VKLPKPSLSASNNVVAELTERGDPDQGPTRQIATSSAWTGGVLATPRCETSSQPTDGPAGCTHRPGLGSAGTLGLPTALSKMKPVLCGYGFPENALENSYAVFSVPIEPFGFVVPRLLPVAKRGHGCDRVFTGDAGVLSFDIFNREDKSSAPGKVQGNGQTLECCGVHGQGD